jgi:purine-nucleoside phosphorylase
MSTPHIAAEPGEIAPLVLMPGDPRRGRRIAEQFFDEPRLVTDVRSIEGWTGSIRGRAITVLASGMGIPSMSIYATELFRFYDVQRIVRVGTTGGMATGQPLGELIIASSAHTDSALPGLGIPGVSLSHTPSYRMLEAAVSAARTRALEFRVGPVLSSDTFYGSSRAKFEALAAVGTLGVEMESAGLYAIAAAEGREALTVLTVTDHVLDGGELSALERETGYTPMVEVAVDALFS